MAGLVNFIAKCIGAGTLFALLGSCVTYPYQTSFAACDYRAGQCYRDCETYDGTPDYGACHADCEYDADQCFADAYGPYSSSYGPGYPSPWYGSYGAWYPQTGFVFSYSRYSNRYGHDRYRGRRYRDHDHDDHGGPGGGNSGGNQPPYTQRYPRTGDPVEPGYNSGDGVGQRNNRSSPRQQRAPSGHQGGGPQGGSQGSSGNSGPSGVTSQSVAPPPSRSSGEGRSEPRPAPRNEGQKQPQ